MATRCFCPPLSLTPRSPTSVAYLMRGTIRGNQNALIMLSACSQHAKRCNQKQSDALRLREQHRTRRNQTQSDCASSIVPVGEPFDEWVRVRLAARGLDSHLNASTCALR